MRIATKLIAGNGVLIGLMGLVLTYQVLLIRTLESGQHHLATVNFRAAETALDMMRILDRIEDSAQSVAAGTDPRFAAELDDLERDFAVAVDRLDALQISPEERAELDRLRRFRDEAGQLLARLRREPRSGPGQLPPELVEQIDKLKTQTKTVYQATLQRRNLEVREADEMARRAKWISWSAAAIALAIAGLVLLVILRSIAEPLRALTIGARAISEGKFFYRLDTSRRDEFAQLAKDFNTMTARLSELETMKKGFVSHVSHELKAPLASMQETTHLMLEEIAGPLNAKQRRLLELNFEGGKRLTTMLGNLLDLSRLEAGLMEYELRLEDAGALLRSAAHQFEDPAAQKGMRIDLRLPNEPVVVHCDPDRILQVLGNIVGNAVKFAPKESTIQLALERTDTVPDSMPSSRRAQLGHPADRSGYALLSVADRGSGVPGGHKEKVFEKFHQVTGGKKVTGQGIGLGLAICRIIVEAHQGALWVEDNPGGGSIFRVLLRERLNSEVAPEDEAELSPARAGVAGSGGEERENRGET
jgi:two-component system sensor histidine kinase GlrK